MLWKKVHVEFFSSHRKQNTVANTFVKRLPSCVTHMRLDFKNRDFWTGKLSFGELSGNLGKHCSNLKVLIIYGAILYESILSVINLCNLFLKNVTSLAIFYSQFIDCPSRGAYVGTSKIKVLNLFGSYLGRFNEPPFSNMPELTELYLARTDVDRTWFIGNSSFLNQLHVLDLGDICIDSTAFQIIKDNALNLKELYLCGADDLEDDDLKFDNLIPHLKTVCLKFCEDVSCEGIVSLIQSCPSLQNVYVDENVFGACALHPFFIENKSKLKIVKVISCSSHKKLSYYL